jgi:hypothetical protein
MFYLPSSAFLCGLRSSKYFFRIKFHPEPAEKFIGAPSSPNRLL